MSDRLGDTSDRLGDLESEAWRGLVEMRVRLFAHLGRLLQHDSDLSMADYEVLAHLSEAPDSRIRVFELAERLQWERSRLSHQLTRMEGRGLIERQGCPSDGRGAYIALTPGGCQAVGAASPGHVDAVRRHFIDALDRDQLEAMADIAKRVLETLP